MLLPGQECFPCAPCSAVGLQEGFFSSSHPQGAVLAGGLWGPLLAELGVLLSELGHFFPKEKFEVLLNPLKPPQTMQCWAPGSDLFVFPCVHGIICGKMWFLCGWEESSVLQHSFGMNSRVLIKGKAWFSFWTGVWWWSQQEDASRRVKGFWMLLLQFYPENPGRAPGLSPHAEFPQHVELC